MSPTVDVKPKSLPAPLPVGILSNQSLTEAPRTPGLIKKVVPSQKPGLVKKTAPTRRISKPRNSAGVSRFSKLTINTECLPHAKASQSKRNKACFPQAKASQSPGRDFTWQMSFPSSVSTAATFEFRLSEDPLLTPARVSLEEEMSLMSLSTLEVPRSSEVSRSCGLLTPPGLSLSPISANTRVEDERCFLTSLGLPWAPIDDDEEVPDYTAASVHSSGTCRSFGSLSSSSSLC